MDFPCQNTRWDAREGSRSPISTRKDKTCSDLGGRLAFQSEVHARQVARRRETDRTSISRDRMRLEDDWTVVVLKKCKDTYQALFWVLIDLIIGFLGLIIKVFDNQTESWA